MRIVRWMAFMLGLLAADARAQLLVYSFTGNSALPTSSDPSVSGSAFTSAAGSGTATTGGSAYTAGSGGGYFSASAWTGAAPGTNYFEFTITPLGGGTVTLTSLSFGYRSSNNGATAFAIRSSTDNYAASLASAALTTSPTVWYSSGSLSLGSMSFTTPTTFRIYGSGASNAGGTFRVDDVTVAGFVSGSSIPEPSTYALFAGCSALAVAYWRRRRR